MHRGFRMPLIHKKRTVKFLVLFAMMLIFAVIEDVLAAHFSGATLILETLPLIVAMSFVFTLITEYVEERFEGGEQPLEHLLKTLERMERKNIPLTYENIRKHLSADVARLIGAVEHLERNNIPPTYENIKKHLRADVDYMEYEIGVKKRGGRA